jgi:Tfp pilus assembly protein PilZ
MAADTDGRRDRRVELFAQVQVSRDATVYIMATSNISVGGMFIQGNPEEYPDLVVGTEVELMIFMPDDAHELGCNAKVVHVQQRPQPSAQSGFGLAFVNLSSTQLSSLEALLEDE